MTNSFMEFAICFFLIGMHPSELAFWRCLMDMPMCPYRVIYAPENRCRQFLCGGTYRPGRGVPDICNTPWMFATCVEKHKIRCDRS